MKQWFWISSPECDMAADVVFVIDSSGSITKPNYEFLLDLVQDIAVRLDVNNADSDTSGVRVGMVTFSYGYVQQFNLNEHMNTISLLNALDVAYHSGTTNTAAALK